MKRLISIVCVCCTLFSSISSAFVKRETDIVLKATIPFSFSSNKQNLEEYISLKGYNNAKILDYYTDNGEIEVNKEDNLAEIKLCDGKYSSGSKIVTKIKNIHVEEEAYNNIINKNIDEEVKEIISVDGDFKSAKIINPDKIQISINPNEVGKIIESNNQTTFSEVKIEIPADNKKREVTSIYYELPFTPIDIKTVKSTNGLAEVELKNNNIRVRFSNGVPSINETTKVGGYTYFWADRANDGSFKKEYPNSVYRSDRKYFTGEGEYIDGDKAVRELSYEIENDINWEDYSGVIIDGIKYMYIFNKSKGIPELNDRFILEEDVLSLDGQWCNTEHLDVEFEDDLIRYIPTGKLYSMGDIIKNTVGWGAIEENKGYESTDTFYNELTGKIETYVKHFKFFYGPKEKIVFGGYFTYPYSATIKYEHYKPITVYSGDIVYSYEEEEDYDGYNYNGWIKISYTETRTVNDYPPTAPYNVRYESKVVWNPGTDDYTPENKLKYEIEEKNNNNWKKVCITDEGVTELNCTENEFRVRTIDETNQVSDWAYSGDSEIEIYGSVKPQTIYKGDSIDIDAFTKSLNNVVKVTAENKELGIDEELEKVSEDVPNFAEVSLKLVCNYTKKPFINTKDDTWAYNDGESSFIRSFSSDALAEGSILKCDLPKTLKINKSGTVILPNQNYLGTPLEFSRFCNSWWYFNASTTLNMKSKVTNKNEQFLYFLNDRGNTEVGKQYVLYLRPYIKLHTFQYEDKAPQYIKIPIDINIAGEPISVTWDTVENVTNFNIYFGDNLVYVHSVNYADIENNVEGFTRYDIGKCIYLLRKITSGFDFSLKNTSYSWPKMKQAGLLSNMKWLGYTVKSDLISEDTLDDYNNAPTTRDVNRLLFMDKSISLKSIKKYLNLIRTTNIPLKKNNEDTIFANFVRERKCEFSVKDVNTKDDVDVGTYYIKVTAYDDKGNVEFIELPVCVVEEISVDKKEDSFIIGRVLYDSRGSRVLEELSKPNNINNSNGFISAGETLGLVLELDGTDFIEININGDKSIITYDSLTKRFLEDEPLGRGQDVYNISDNYDFPIVINSNNNDNRFLWLYTIPYRTKQSLESWSSLREKYGDSEIIDRSKLFNRISEPYELIVIKNGQANSEIKIKFDVFERWDTVLNRDVSSYLSNYLKKWRMEL